MQVGVGISLFNQAGKAKVKAAKVGEQLAEAKYQVVAAGLQAEIKKAVEEQRKFRSALAYFKSSALPQADVIVHNAFSNYKNGNINYLEWGMLMQNAINIRMQYLDAIRGLNNSIFQIQYLIE